jgi:hypothetical protein
VKAITDAEGRFQMTGLPCHGDALLVAASPGGGQYIAVRIGPGVGYVAEMKLQPLGKASGRILKPDGAPLADTAVEVSCELLQRAGFWRGLESLGGGRQARTDAEGNWQVEGLVGGLEYQLMVPMPDEPDSRMQADTFEALGGETVQVGETRLDAEEWQ